MLRTSYDKTCAECSQPFTSKRSDARYCSGDCHRRAYDRENAEHIREVRRVWQAANRERIRQIKQKSEDKHGNDWRAAKRERYATEGSDEHNARKAASRAYYQANRERILAAKKTADARARNLASSRRSAHGAEWDEIYTSFWKSQDGKCYLCERDLDQEASRAIQLDHDHRCCPMAKSCQRCRRGLACKECNRVVGILQDDPERIRRIAGNLEKAMALVTARLQE